MSKRKGFDLHARVAVTQQTQKKYSALQASAASKAAPGRVPASKLAGATQDIAQALREMRDTGCEYHDGDSSVEVEVRLGRFLSKSTGLRYDYGKELYVLPSSKGTIQADASFESGVSKEHYDRIQAALQRATTLGQLACEHTAEEVYIYDTQERGTSNRLFVEGATQTPLAMQTKKSIREADACIFMPSPLSDCDARIGISVETDLPSSRLPKTVPGGWGRRRQRDRYSYSVPGGAPGEAAAGWRVDLTTVVSTESNGMSDKTYELELELQPDATETFFSSEDEAWLVELSDALWWGSPPCGVGRLAGLTVDDSMPMALLPSEPLPGATASSLVGRCRAFCGAEASDSGGGPSSFPGSEEARLDRPGLRAMHEGPPAAPPCFLSARPNGHRYLLFLQGNGGSSGALGGEGAWLLAPDGRGFALLGAPFVKLAHKVAGKGPTLFDGHLCPVLAPSLRTAGFKAVFLITDLLAHQGEKMANQPFRRRYRKLVTEFVGHYRSQCGHPPDSVHHPMLLQAMPYFEVRPPKGAPVWSYDLIAPEGPAGNNGRAGRVFDDRRPTHPTPLRHLTDGVVLTPDLPYNKTDPGQPLPMSWVFPDQDSVRLRCWTRKPAFRTRQLQVKGGGGAETALLAYAACMSRAPAQALSDAGEDGDGDESGAGGGTSSGYIEEVVLRPPQWKLGEADLKALADAEASDRAKGGASRAEAGVVADCIFEPAGGVWRVLRFHTRGTDSNGGKDNASAGTSSSKARPLCTIGEVMAMLQRRAEGITAEEILPPTHRPPSSSRAPPGGTVSQMSRSSSSSTSKTSSSAAKADATSVSSVGAQSSAVRPSWAPGANKRAAAGASTRGDDDDDGHPWVTLQAKDPRFALAVAESKHPSPPEFFGDQRLGNGS